MLCGIDISKHGVRVAAKRDPQGLYAVASTYRMPIITGRVDTLIAHVSPISVAEFARVVKPGGVVLVGSTGDDHLYAFKRLLYDTPEPHEVVDRLAGESCFVPLGVHRIRYPLRLRGAGQLANLLRMTPFYWSVSAKVRLRLEQIDFLDTEVDVAAHTYRRVE